MKVGLVVPEYPPDTIGGGGVVFEALARGLHAAGHDVRVLTSATAGGPPGGEAPFPLLRVRQWRHFTPQYRTYMPPAPFALAPARAFLRGCDVVHLHGYGMAFIDLAALRADRRRTVFTSHGLPYTARRSRGALGLAYRAYDRVFGRRVLESRIVTAVSTHAAAEIADIAPYGVRVIPNGLSMPAPSIACAPEVEREIAKGPYLLTVGRIEALKGYRDAIAALAEVARRGAPLRLILAGEESGAGPALRDLARRSGIEDRTSFVGRLERADVARLYAGATATLVTSRTESFSLVGLEAMSAGCPAILADVGGIADYARDRENALMVAPGDPAGIAAAIAELLERPALAAHVAAGGRATAARYSWDAIVERYVAVYRECREGSS